MEPYYFLPPIPPTILRLISSTLIGATTSLAVYKLLKHWDKKKRRRQEG